MQNIELDPSEWRLKGARRIKAFKKQPAVPIGNPAYRGGFRFLVTVCGIWAGIVITWARATPGQDPLTIAAVALGPGLILLGLLVLFDH